MHFSRYLYFYDIIKSRSIMSFHNSNSGGGLEMALSCDIRVASENAKVRIIFILPPNLTQNAHKKFTIASDTIRSLSASTGLDSILSIL